MRLPILALIGVAIVLQTGCVTGRRALSLPVSTHEVPSATRGQKDNDSVTKRVRLLVEEELHRKGYGVTDDRKAPVSAAVSVDEFWGWGTPGFWALTFEAKIQCTISVTNSAGPQTAVVKGYGINHGQVAKDANWQEAFDPAFEDFMSNFGTQWDGLVAGPPSASGAPR